MPGAGSLQAANWLYVVAPKDGTAIATIGRGVPMSPLLGGTGATFDATKFTYVGSMNNEVSVAAAWHTSGIKTIEDVMQRELLVGATAVGIDDTTIFPAVVNAIIGTKFKWIGGYPGGNDMNLAMERDRAVFHFLTTSDARDAYVERVARSMKVGGRVIVATFGPEGPTKCSGLDVVRYDAESLHSQFGRHFELMESAIETHHTPFGTTQQFLYCLCRVE